MNEEKTEGLTVTPIIIKEIGGTLYAVYGYFSPSASETATAKTKRLILKESGKKISKNR